MWLSCREWTLPLCVLASHANTRKVQPLPSGNHRPLAGFRQWCVNNFHGRSIPCDGKSQGRFPKRWALGAGLWRGTDFNRPPPCRQRELRDKELQAENSREAPDKVSAVRPRGVTDLDSLHEPWWKWPSVSNETLTWDVGVITSAALFSEAHSESRWNVRNPPEK